MRFGGDTTVNGRALRVYTACFDGKLDEVRARSQRTTEPVAG